MLSERQVAYAATDAWIGREVFLRMRELGLALEPGTPAPGKPASDGTSGANKTGARKRRPRRPRAAV